MIPEDDATPVERLLWTGKPGSARLWHGAEWSPAQRASRLGVVTCEHERQVIAGQVTDLCFVFEAPQHGLPARSRLRIAWRWPFDWRPAHAQDPTAQSSIDGTDVDLPVAHVPRGAFDPWQHQLDIALKVPLDAGQVLQIRPGCGNGWRAPTMACDSVDFLIALWQPEDPRWNLVGVTSAPVIVPGDGVCAVAVAGGDAVVGEGVDVHLRVEDEWGNTTVLPAGPPVLLPSEAVEQLDLRLETQPDVALLRLRFLQPGLQRPNFDVPGVGRVAGNAIQVHAEPPALRLYFGDLHSGQSDVGCGAGSLTQHFRHARAAGLQFASQQANDHYITQARWASIRRDTAKAERPGEFVAVLGCEWSPPTKDGGDRNVFYQQDEPRMRRSGRHFAEIDEDPEPDLMTAAEFHAAFGEKAVLCNLHVGGRPTNLDWHEPGIEPLFEIHSTHATSEWFVEDAIERGYRVGITAGADGVYGRPGADHPGWRQNRNVRSGLTGVYAVALDQTSLWQAFSARRCYGTTGERISLGVEIEGEGMGGEIEASGDEISVAVCIAGTAALERVDVLRQTDVIDSRQLAGADADGALRILWSGAEKRGTAADQRVIWNGDLIAERGRFTAAAPVNFHTREDVVAVDDEGCRLRWTSATAGNRAGVLFHFDGPDDTRLSFRSEPCQFDVLGAELRQGTRIIEAGGLKRRVEIGPAPDTSASPDADLRFKIPVRVGTEAVWVRVIQIDGAMAWSSPVTVHRH